MGYMPSHPLSLRKTREAAFKSAGLIDQHAEIINKHGQALAAVGAFFRRDFWGRLRWLFTGK